MLTESHSSITLAEPRCKVDEYWSNEMGAGKVNRQFFFMLKKMTSMLVFYSGLAFLSYRWFTRNKVIILAYHSVGNVPVNFIHSPNRISLPNFEKQIEYLLKRYHFCTLEKFVEYAHSGIRLPEHLVIVTFDDGYKDHYSSVYPILRRHRIPATFFLPTEYMEGKKIKWEDELTFLAKTSNARKGIIKVNGKKAYRWRNVQGRDRAINRMVIEISRLDQSKRKKLLNRILGQLRIRTEGSFPSDIMLSWDEIKEMSKADGISFGCHTVSHINVSSLTPDEVRQEVVESRIRIEKSIGRKIKFFSYPYGKSRDLNQQTKAILKRAGITCAVSTISGINDIKSDLFELKRICVNPEDDLIMFICDLVGFYKVRRLYEKLAGW